MKVLLVTSRLTFVPENYRGFLETVLENAGECVAGVVLVDNFTAKQLAVIPALYAMGASGIATTMLKNAVGVASGQIVKMVRTFGVPVLVTTTMNAPQMVEQVKDMGIDLIVNARTRDIYREAILGAPRLGCINVHHGLLPEERGVNCDLFALAEGRPAGFTIHRMTQKIDDGSLLLRRVVSETKENDYMAYVQRGSVLEGESVASLLQSIADLDSVPQGEPNVSEQVIYRKLKPSREAVREFRRQGVRI